MKISSAGAAQLQSFIRAQSLAALQKRSNSDRPISLPAPLYRPINQPAPSDITTSSANVEGAWGETYWTAERMREAQPLPLPAIPFLLTGSDRPISLPAPLDRPINQPAPSDITTSSVSVEGAEGEGYWTAERMREAQPLPLPTIPFPLGAPVSYDTQPSLGSQRLKRTA